MPLDYENPDIAKLARTAKMWRAVAVGLFAAFWIMIALVCLFASGTWTPWR